MTENRKQPPAPTALTETVSTNITLADLNMVHRVMKRYGVKRATAVRMLMLAGAQHHDPMEQK